MANRNFTYAPGLPGFGTRGIDGSTGLQGLAYYFSEFDGVTDTVTIKTKILSNKILFSTDELLPGYPARRYQTGDLFMDTNGLIWAIDLNESNKYVSTPGSVAGDEFFEFLRDIPAIGFGRWYNNFTTSKALVDIVLRNSGAIDYTTLTSNIYVTNPDQAAQWKYVDVLSPGNGNNYYPFTIFSNGSDDNAMAIVRDQSVNTWHIGNLDDSGVQRAIDLQLDFQEIKLGGDLTFIDNTAVNHDIMAVSPLTNGSGQIRILTGEGTSPTIKAGDIQLNSGGGFIADTSIGGAAGDINIIGGKGGDSSTGLGTLTDLGQGADVNIRSGRSGTWTLSTGGFAGVYDEPTKAGNIHIATGGNTSLNLAGGEIGIECASTLAFFPGGPNSFIDYGAIYLKAGIINLESRYDVSIRGGDDVNITSNNDIILVAGGTAAMKASFGQTIDISLNQQAGYGIGYKFGGGSGVPAMFIHNYDTALDAEALDLRFGPSSAGASYADAIVFRSNSGIQLDVLEVNNTGARFASTSDARLKGNIIDASLTALQIVEDVSLRNFQMRIIDASGAPTNDLHPEILLGYIAQEIKEIYPFAVSYRDKMDPSSYMGVDKVSMVPLLHKAIQELSSEKAVLLDRIITLESQVAQLIAIVDPSIT